MALRFLRSSCLTRKVCHSSLRQLLLWLIALIVCSSIFSYSLKLVETAWHGNARGEQHGAVFSQGSSPTYLDGFEGADALLEHRTIAGTGKLPSTNKHGNSRAGSRSSALDELDQEEGLSLLGGVKATSKDIHTGSNRNSSSPRFILYRLVGNDMPPLQRPGQLLWNTRYILDNESYFPDCWKKWILNRILNQTSSARLRSTLDRFGYGRQDIIEIEADIGKLMSNASADDWESSVVAQNAARNVALADGVRLGATWLLVFDGNIFVTDEGWRAIVASADKAEQLGLKYFKVPMYRLFREQDPSWLNKSTQYANVAGYLPVKGESQIAIHRDAKARFDEKRGYGSGNKLVFIYNTCGRKVSTSSPCLCGEVFAEDFEEGVNKSKSFNLDVVARCGYVVRLWPHFDTGVNETRALRDSVYRGELRVKAKARLRNLVQEAVRNRGLS